MDASESWNWSASGTRQCEATIESGWRKGEANPIDIDTIDWRTTDYTNAGDASRGDDGLTDDETNSSTADSEARPQFADSLLTRSDLRNMPPPQPLIDNVLDQGTTALLYGKWGTCKTFIALDWAASVATGRPWQNRKTQQRRVLYIVAEGAFGFGQRAQAWETAWQSMIDDDWLSVYPQPINLMNARDVANLRDLIEWGAFGFVVLDTLARCMVGADENSAQDCGIVIDTMTKLRASTPGGRGVILGVHHAGKDAKTLRGSSALESCVDTVYATSRDEAWISLAREKRKDGPEHDNHLLKLDLIPGTESAVMSSSARNDGEQLPSERSAELLVIFVQNFETTGASGAELRDIAEAAGMSRATFYRALNDLLRTGKLVNAGTVKRPHYLLG
ncbi:AAA family ATPase [Mycobacterium sp. ENV421]|uniref:AAA family ATPase n=1 Tax=Mycobacterium sp. ENV421 TaxID=1213407 RepID=UPI001157B8DD|nr:AAA family ATPase [Mycobacterium sp. ENV421]